MTEFEVVALKAELAKRISDNDFGDIDELIARLNQVPSEKTSYIIELFYTISAQGAKYVQARDISWIESIVALRDGVTYIKEWDNPMIENLQLSYMSDMDNANEFFASYEIKDVPWASYYGTLIQIFYKLQMFDRIDEAEGMVQTKMQEG